MKKIITAIAILVALTVPGAADQTAAGAMDTLRSLSAKSSQPARCCVVCSKGKPCGDSCIAQNRTCHRGQGCAC